MDKLEEVLEPSVPHGYGTSWEIQACISIAISLKRIADSLQPDKTITEKFEELHGYKP